MKNEICNGMKALAAKRKMALGAAKAAAQAQQHGLREREREMCRAQHLTELA